MKAYVVTGIVYLTCMWLLMAALTGCKSHRNAHPGFEGMGGGGDTSGQGGAGGSADKLGGPASRGRLDWRLPALRTAQQEQDLFRLQQRQSDFGGDDGAGQGCGLYEEESGHVPHRGPLR